MPINIFKNKSNQANAFRKPPPSMLPQQSISGTKGDALPPLTESARIAQNANLQNQLTQQDQQVNPIQNFSSATPNQNQTSPTLQNPNLNQPKKNIFSKGKSLLLVVIILFILLLSASAALAYNNYQIFSPPQPLKNIIEKIIISTPLPKNARMVLEKSTLAMLEVDTLFVASTLNLQANAADYPIDEANIEIKGPLQLNNCDNRKAEAEISGQFTTEGISLSATVLAKIIEDKAYFNIVEFPGGSFFPTDDIKNKWYFQGIDESDNFDLAQFCQNSDEIKKIIEDFVQDSYNWTQKIDSDEKNVTLLKLTPPQSNLGQLFLDLTKHANKGQAQEENVEDLLKNIKNLEILAKIDKKTFLLNQISTQIEVALQTPPTIDFPDEISQTPSGATPITLSVTLDFSKYNEPIIIEVPDNAVSIEELGSAAFGESFILDPGLTETKARDKVRKTDLELIAKALDRVKEDSEDGFFPNDLATISQSDNPYITNIPRDPLTYESYFYATFPEGCEEDCTDYQLTACLEDSSDTQKDPVIYGNCTIASYTLTSLSLSEISQQQAPQSLLQEEGSQSLLNDFTDSDLPVLGARKSALDWIIINSLFWIY